MGAVSELVRSGAAADIVLLAMAVELAVLVALGRDPRAVLAALLPGALIVLALRAALAGEVWWWIAFPLALSFPLHLADLRARGWLVRGGRSANAPTSNKEWRGI